MKPSRRGFMAITGATTLVPAGIKAAIQADEDPFEVYKHNVAMIDAQNIAPTKTKLWLKMFEKETP